MRTAITLLTCALFASTLHAKGVVICPEDSRIAYTTWDQDGFGRTEVVTLDRPLSERSKLSAADVALMPHCAREHAEWPLTITCAGVEGAPLTEEFVRGNRVSYWSSRLRPTGDGEETFYLRTSSGRDSSSGVRRVRTALRERVSKEVERELVLFETDCAD